MFHKNYFVSCIVVLANGPSKLKLKSDWSGPDTGLFQIDSFSLENKKKADKKIDTFLFLFACYSLLKMFRTRLLAITNNIHDIKYETNLPNLPSLPVFGAKR